MQEDFEEKVPTSRRSLQDEELWDENPVGRILQQSLDSLKKRYPWILHFQREHPDYPFLQHEDVPWTPWESSLAEARVALVTTAGVYPVGQKPFRVAPEEVPPELSRYRFREKGDPSFRIIAGTTAGSELRIAHPYMDLAGPLQDINTVFPIDRLRELEEENFIGSAAQVHLSFMGYLPHPAELEEVLPEALQVLAEDGVDAVILTAGEVLSHQTMAFVQRSIESQGISTVAVTLCHDVLQKAGTPRAVHYAFPFGYVLGDANDDLTQLRILKDTLRALEEIQEAGTILELPYEWVEA